MLNLKNVIDNLPSAVIVVNSDRRVMMANKMAQIFSGKDEKSLFDKRAGYVMGCTFSTRLTEGGRWEKSCKFCEAKIAIARAFREKVDIEPFETLIETEQRGPLYFRFTVTLLKDPRTGHTQGSESAAIVTIDDMTEYKKRERLEAVMETVGAICHEMNQPLMVLTGQLDLLTMDIGENRRIDAFREQVERMGAITRKLHTIKGYAAKPYLNNNLRILDMEKSCA